MQQQQQQQQQQQFWAEGRAADKLQRQAQGSCWGRRACHALRHAAAQSLTLATHPHTHVSYCLDRCASWSTRLTSSTC
jgi:hypothetical protein